MDCDKIIKSYGNNKIWCNYHGVTGTKYYKILFSFIIVTIPYILLLSILISSRNNLSISFSITISSLFYIIILISLIRSGCSDPGILHKQERDYNYLPRKNFVKMRISGNLYDVYFCPTCFLYKPPRTSHCALCNNCILRFDHHCNWIGHCIGQKNYGAFYILIFSLFFSCIFDVILSLYHIIFQARKFKNKENYNNLILWGFCVICLYNIIILVGFIGKLFLLHTYLQFINKTFYEYLRKKFYYIPGKNPFKKYMLYICKRLVLKCPGKSLFLYFVRNPEKLKLMTLDNEVNINGPLEFKIDKGKTKKKYDLPKIDFEKIKKDGKINDIDLNDEKDNNTKDDGESAFNMVKPLNLKNHASQSSSQETDKINNIFNDDTHQKEKYITIIK